MAEKIPLVTGDNLPRVGLLIKKKDGTAADLTGCTGAVLYFRAKGSTGTPETIVCDVDIPNSKIFFEFPDGVLSTAGDFEGEVEIDFNGKILTLFEPLQFKVRNQFA